MNTTPTSTSWDVVVVGAGPAGSIAARECARLGLRVLLVDKAHFPRKKVCGCCLNGNALSALQRIGLGDIPLSLGGIALNSVRIGANKNSATLSHKGISVSREALDIALIREAVRAGAVFQENTSAKMGELVGDGRTVYINGQPHIAKVLLAADGLNGRFATETRECDAPAKADSRLGGGVVLRQAPSFYERGCIFMATGRGGYVGLVRVEDDQLDVAVAMDAPFVRSSGGLGPAAEFILNEAGFPPIPGLGEADWKGTPALTRKPTRIAGERWFRIGDAAGYIEPFTGEGMAWAISGASAIAPLVKQACVQWTPQLEREWQLLHKRLIGKRQRVCRAVAWALRSPRLCSTAVRVLRVWPGLSAPVVRALNRPAHAS